MTQPTTAPSTTDRRDLGVQLAEFVTRTEYADLPQAAVEGAKKTILDSLGVTLAASGLEPATANVVDLVRESGGRPESSVLGCGFKAPAVMAAFANGSMAHSLNYDDQTPWGQHSSASVVPAAFAVAERRGGVSGRDLITAVAIGQDIFTRLRCNVTWRQDWNLSTVLGGFAATATAARLLGASGQQVVNAFGINSMQSGGLMELVTGIGSELGGLYAGFPAKNAVLSALLALRGTRGVDSVLEGRAGVLTTYFPGGYDKDAMLAGLGSDFKGAVTLYKPWAAIGTAHSHVHATVGLVSDLDLDVDDIAEIIVYVGDTHEVLCEPLDRRREPTSLLDARFSLPFLVALAAVRRGLRVSDLDTAALSDPRVLALARKVVPVSDSSLDWKLELPLGRVEMVMTDGRRHERVASGVPGSAVAPMTWDDIATKFSDCAALAAQPPSTPHIAEAQALARDLELTRDATQLLHIVSPSD